MYTPLRRRLTGTGTTTYTQQRNKQITTQKIVISFIGLIYLKQTKPNNNKHEN